MDRSSPPVRASISELAAAASGPLLTRVACKRQWTHHDVGRFFDTSSASSSGFRQGVFGIPAASPNLSSSLQAALLQVSVVSDQPTVHLHECAAVECGACAGQ